MYESDQQSNGDQGSTQLDKVSSLSLAALSLFIIGYLVAALWFFFEGWVNEFAVMKPFWGIPPDNTLPLLVRSALFSITGALMGCGVLSIVSFYNYVSVQNSFSRQHLWGYYLGPFLACVIGLITFALLQSGLLVFSGSSGGGTSISHLGYLVMGFISGYGWYQFTVKVDELVGKILSIKKRPSVRNNRDDSASYDPPSVSEDERV